MLTAAQERTAVQERGEVSRQVAPGASGRGVRACAQADLALSIYGNKGGSGGDGTSAQVGQRWPGLHDVIGTALARATAEPGVTSTRRQTPRDYSGRPIAFSRNPCRCVVAHTATVRSSQRPSCPAHRRRAVSWAPTSGTQHSGSSTYYVALHCAAPLSLVSAGPAPMSSCSCVRTDVCSRLRGRVLRSGRCRRHRHSADAARR